MEPSPWRNACGLSHLKSWAINHRKRKQQQQQQLFFHIYTHQIGFIWDSFLRVFSCLAADWSRPNRRLNLEIRQRWPISRLLSFNSFLLLLLLLLLLLYWFTVAFDGAPNLVRGLQKAKNLFQKSTRDSSSDWKNRNGTSGETEPLPWQSQCDNKSRGESIVIQLTDYAPVVNDTMSLERISISYWLELTQVTTGPRLWLWAPAP